MTNIDIGIQTNLQSLSCGNNLLTAIDVSNNPMLIQLECNGNMISNLDLRNNTQLVVLGCYDNRLSELNASMIVPFYDHKYLIYCGRQKPDGITDGIMTLTLKPAAASYWKSNLASNSLNINVILAD